MSDDGKRIRIRKGKAEEVKTSPVQAPVAPTVTPKPVPPPRPMTAREEVGLPPRIMSPGRLLSAIDLSNANEAFGRLSAAASELSIRNVLAETNFANALSPFMQSAMATRGGRLSSTVENASNAPRGIPRTPEGAALGAFTFMLEVERRMERGGRLVTLKVIKDGVLVAAPTITITELALTEATDPLAYIASALAEHLRGYFMQQIREGLSSLGGLR